MTVEQLTALIGAELDKRLPNASTAERQEVGKAIFEQKQAGVVPDLDNSKPGAKWNMALTAMAAACSHDPQVVGQWVEKNWGANHPMAQLTIGTNVSASGGVLVQPVFADDFLEILRPETLVMNMGAREMPMTTGNLNITGGASGATASYVGENSARRATTMTFRNVNLVERILRCIVPASNQSLAAVPNMGSIIQADALAACADATDDGLLYGTGTTGGPVGLYWQIASGNRLQATATPDLDKVTTDLGRAIEAISGANVRYRSLTWGINSRTREYLRRLRDTGNGFAFKGDVDRGVLDGHKLVVSNNVSSTSSSTFGVAGSNSDVFLFAPEHIVLASNPTVRVQVFPGGAYADSGGTVVSGLSNDQTVFAITMGNDIGMRHTSAGAIIYDAAWTNVRA